MDDLVALGSRIERILNQVWDEGECYEKNGEQNFHLRPSSFNYCPLRFYFGLPKMLSKGKYQEATMMFYVKIGSAVHHVIQEALSNIDSGKALFVRDWICNKCTHRHILMKKPDECAKCGNESLLNDEHTIEDGILLGHVDDVIVAKGIMYPLDYKTTSISRMERSGVLPEKKHIAQLGAYAALLKKQGRKIGGFFLVYIARDNPRKIKTFYFELTKKLEENSLAQIEKWKKQHLRVLNIKDLQDTEPLVLKRICRTKDDVKSFCGNCAYERICTRNDTHVTEQVARTFNRIQKKLPIIQHLKKRHEPTTHKSSAG